MSRAAGGFVGATIATVVLLVLSFPLSVSWPWAAGAALSLGALGYVLSTRRVRRREAILSTPLPKAHRATLEKWVGFYRDLDEAERTRFEGEVQVFLDEQVITGPKGADIEDELSVLVAASAVAIAFGHQGFRYPRLRDIVIYDEAFNDEYEVGRGNEVLGMVHAQGPILFSARSLRHGFRGENDAHNVGYHEFAHVIDFDGGRADGVPGFMPWGVVDPWVSVMHDEIQRVESERSVLRDYAATNEAEFFAVATEAFFEKPKQLKARHPELYALLVKAYRLDPAK
ncbi:MAG: zinc-dependent peptidase [Sandaracinaceae bacterium]